MWDPARACIAENRLRLSTSGSHRKFRGANSRASRGGLDAAGSETHAELLAVIGLAVQTNHIVTGMQIPVDEAFLVEE